MATMSSHLEHILGAYSTIASRFPELTPAQRRLLARPLIANSLVSLYVVSALCILYFATVMLFRLARYTFPNLRFRVPWSNDHIPVEVTFQAAEDEEPLEHGECYFKVHEDFTLTVTTPKGRWKLDMDVQALEEALASARERRNIETILNNYARAVCPDHCPCGETLPVTCNIRHLKKGQHVVEPKLKVKPAPAPAPAAVRAAPAPPPAPFVAVEAAGDEAIDELPEFVSSDSEDDDSSSSDDDEAAPPARPTPAPTPTTHPIRKRRRRRELNVVAEEEPVRPPGVDAIVTPNSKVFGEYNVPTPSTKAFEVATASSCLLRISSLPAGAVILHASPPGETHMECHGGGARVKIYDNSNVLVTSAHLMEALLDSPHPIRMRTSTDVGGLIQFKDVPLPLDAKIVFYSHKNDRDQVHIDIPSTTWSNLGISCTKMAERSMRGAQITALWVDAGGRVFKSYGSLTSVASPLMLEHDCATREGSSGFMLYNKDGRALGPQSHGFKGRQINVLSSLAQFSPTRKRKVFELSQAAYEYDSMTKDLADLGYGSVRDFIEDFNIKHNIMDENLIMLSSAFYHALGSGYLVGQGDAYGIEAGDSHYTQFDDDEDLTVGRMAELAMTTEQWNAGKRDRMLADRGMMTEAEMDDIDNIAFSNAIGSLTNHGEDIGDYFDVYDGEGATFEAALKKDILNVKEEIKLLRTHESKVLASRKASQARVTLLQQELAELRSEQKELTSSQVTEKTKALAAKRELSRALKEHSKRATLQKQAVAVKREAAAKKKADLLAQMAAHSAELALSKAKVEDVQRAIKGMEKDEQREFFNATSVDGESKQEEEEEEERDEKSPEAPSTPPAPQPRPKPVVAAAQLGLTSKSSLRDDPRVNESSLFHQSSLAGGGSTNQPANRDAWRRTPGSTLRPPLIGARSRNRKFQPHSKQLGAPAAPGKQRRKKKLQSQTASTNNSKASKTGPPPRGPQKQ